MLDRILVPAGFGTQVGNNADKRMLEGLAGPVYGAVVKILKRRIV